MQAYKIVIVAMQYSFNESALAWNLCTVLSFETYFWTLLVRGVCYIKDNRIEQSG